jgi:hypothetical protein
MMAPESCGRRQCCPVARLLIKVELKCHRPIVDCNATERIEGKQESTFLMTAQIRAKQKKKQKKKKI